MFVFPYFYPKIGGAENYILNIAERLKNEFEIVILTAKKDIRSDFGIVILLLYKQLKMKKKVMIKTIKEVRENVKRKIKKFKSKKTPQSILIKTFFSPRNRKNPIGKTAIKKNASLLGWPMVE